MHVEEALVEEASKIKREIETFFSELESRTPISVKEFCYLLPEDWYFTSGPGQLDGLAVSRGDKVYHFHLELDVELDEEGKVIERVKLKRVELEEIYDLTSYEAFGLYEEGNICTPYTEWGLTDLAFFGGGECTSTTFVESIA
jgi:hypothetical protein